MNHNEMPDIFEPFEKLVEIEIGGEKYFVPENNTLLRCFQYLALENISRGDFCWNGDCLNCRVWIDDGKGEKMLVACRAKVIENMRIIKTDAAIEL